MRIAQVLTASTGGIGRHVASVTTRLVQRGHQVRIFCPEVTASAQGFAELGVQVLPLGRLGQAHSADVLHAHGFKAAGLSWPFATVLRVPLVATWHNAVLGTGRSAAAARMLQRAVARGADLTLGASSDLVAEALRLGAPRARLSAVAAPAALADPALRGPTRAALGLAPTDLAVLTVGRLAPQKNLGMLLDIAAALRGRTGLVFLVAGEGPERGTLERRIAAETLPVRLLGARDDVPALLAASDLALLTSTWEARALVAQEALLAGLPLVSTRVGGIEELVGDAAVLVAADDAAEAARHLAALADDPDARRELAAAGRRRAAEWPDEDDVTTDLLKAYAAVATRLRR